MQSGQRKRLTFKRAARIGVPIGAAGVGLFATAYGIAEFIGQMPASTVTVATTMAIFATLVIAATGLALWRASETEAEKGWAPTASIEGAVLPDIASVNLDFSAVASIDKAIFEEDEPELRRLSSSPDLRPILRLRASLAASGFSSPGQALTQGQVNPPWDAAARIALGDPSSAGTGAGSVLSKYNSVIWALVESDMFREQPEATGVGITAVRRSDLVGPMAKTLVGGLSLVLTGQSGIGKTDLARLIAEEAAAELEGATAMWWELSPGDFSMEQRRTDLWQTLAVGLDRPGLLTMPLGARYGTIRQISKINTVILVIDGLEAEEDWDSLFDALGQLKDFVRLLITARVPPLPSPPGFVVERVPPMSASELGQLLRGSGYDVTDVDIARLHLATNGNPKAAVAYAALIRDYGGLVDHGSGVGSRVFQRAYTQLLASSSPHELQLLFAIAQWPAGVSIEHLAGHTGWEERRVRSTAISLVRREMVDWIEGDQSVLSAQAVLKDHLRERDEWGPAHDCWRDYIVKCLTSIGKCWSDIGRLKLLDNESFRTAMLRLLHDSSTVGDHSTAVKIASGSRYYFYVRGIAIEYEWVYMAWIESAKAMGDEVEVADACLYLSNALIKANRVEDGLGILGQSTLLPELLEHSEVEWIATQKQVTTTQKKSTMVFLADPLAREILHVVALAEASAETPAWERARNIWRALVETTTASENGERRNTFMRWWGVSERGLNQLDIALDVWAKAEADAKAIGFSRAQLWTRLAIAEVLSARGDSVAARDLIPAPSSLLTDADDRMLTFRHDILQAELSQDPLAGELATDLRDEAIRLSADRFLARIERLRVASDE